MIGNEYAILRTSGEAKGKTTKELFEMLEDKMNMKELSWTVTSKVAYINVNNEYYLTLLEDGTIKEGKVAILDIADGSIDLKTNGYVQGEIVYSGNNGNGYNVIGDFVEYDGAYVITGTTTKDVVRIVEKGTYDIIIKDLHIDIRSSYNDALSYQRLCAFNANRNKYNTDVFVNINIEGDNKLYGVGPAIGFVSGNISDYGEKASKLVINGDGILHAEGSTAIGSGPFGAEAATGNANNITINSGKIMARKPSGTGCAIGGGNANNIVINGGELDIESSKSGVGIGSYSGIVDNIQINGGKIRVTGGEYGGAIGGGKGSGRVIITGGIIEFSSLANSSSSMIGNNCSSVEITGGTIIGNKLRHNIGIGTIDVTENINITGGSIRIEERKSKYAVPPKSGEKDVYLTQIQLQNVTEEVSITSLVTSDNLTYGIKDMYTTTEGKLYLYLPTGEREITIKTGEKEYTGKVITGDTDSTEVVTLNEK